MPRNDKVNSTRAEGQSASGPGRVTIAWHPSTVRNNGAHHLTFVPTVLKGSETLTYYNVACREDAIYVT